MSRLVALVLSVVLAGAGVAAAAGLDAYRGVRRVMIVFAPNPEDPALNEQRALLISEIEGLKRRDLAVFSIVGADGLIPELGRPPALDVPALRARFRVPAERFAVVLVGLDGREFYRADAAIPPWILFALIDRPRLHRDGAPGARDL